MVALAAWGNIVHLRPDIGGTGHVGEAMQSASGYAIQDWQEATTCIERQRQNVPQSRAQPHQEIPLRNCATALCWCQFGRLDQNGGLHSELIYTKRRRLIGPSSGILPLWIWTSASTISPIWTPTTHRVPARALKHPRPSTLDWASASSFGHMSVLSGLEAAHSTEGPDTDAKSPV